MIITYVCLVGQTQIGVYMQPMRQGAYCHCEFILPYNKENPIEKERMQKFSIKASEVLSDKGAYFSRPYGSWAELAYQKDTMSKNILKEIKNIFDPNGVMNPGKLCF